MKPAESWTARWQGICAHPALATDAAARAPSHSCPRPWLSRVCPPRVAATFVPGCYALRVKGTLHAQHITVLEDNGIRYRSLDDQAAR